MLIIPPQMNISGEDKLQVSCSWKMKDKHCGVLVHDAGVSTMQMNIVYV